MNSFGIAGRDFCISNPGACDENKNVGKATYGLVGAGWRSEFYLRIAQALPERFGICGVVTRNEENAVNIKKRWGVKTYTNVKSLLESSAPDFAVVAVSKDSAAGIIAELSQSGVPVLAETPPAYDLEQLVQMNTKAAGARVQVAEQYHLQPMHAARISIARSGLLGEISEAQVSFSHGYHGVSLMRKFLGVGYENASIRAFEYSSPVIAGPDRNGPPAEENTVVKKHEIALLDFDGRLGLYDFIRDQHRSWVRSQRILVRGVKGEIYDNRLKYLKDFRTPVQEELKRVNAGEEGNMEGYYLKGITIAGEWAYANPFAPARLSDDEIAVAACLAKMKRYVNGGPGFYSLAEASQDAYLALMIDRAMASGEKVLTQSQPWVY